MIIPIMLLTLWGMAVCFVWGYRSGQDNYREHYLNLYDKWLELKRELERRKGAK